MTIECPKCHFDNTDDSLYCGKCTTPLKSSGDVPVEHTETLQTPILIKCCRNFSVSLRSVGIKH